MTSNCYAIAKKGNREKGRNLFFIRSFEKLDIIRTMQDVIDMNDKKKYL